MRKTKEEDQLIEVDSLYHPTLNHTIPISSLGGLKIIILVGKLPLTNLPHPNQLQSRWDYEKAVIGGRV